MCTTPEPCTQMPVTQKPYKIVINNNIPKPTSTPIPKEIIVRRPPPTCSTCDYSSSYLDPTTNPYGSCTGYNPYNPNVYTTDAYRPVYTDFDGVVYPKLRYTT